jgi:hypothetical protein
VTSPAITAADIPFEWPALDPSDRPRGLVGLTLHDLSHAVFPTRTPILIRGEIPILCAGHLAQVYAERGIGKTWFALTLGLIAANGGAALGFSAPAPCRVLDVDGEMASLEIQERAATLCDRLRVSSSATLTTVAADWQERYLPRLDTVAGQDAIEPYVANADLIILDNRSCLFDPEGEKDPTAWQPAQDWLLSLRRRGKAVLLVHHSNRMGGALGHSKAEDPMNLLIKLTRPDDYRQEQGARFVVTFDKARGAYGPAVASFLAQLGPDGWSVESATEHREASISDKLIDYVTLAHEAGDRPGSANAAIRGARVNRSEGLRAWADLTKRGIVKRHHEGGWFCA